MIELTLTIVCGLFLLWFFGTLLVLGLGIIFTVIDEILNFNPFKGKDK